MICGTRGSPLALAQTNMVVALIERQTGEHITIKEITTSGDRYKGRFGVGDATKSLFTKEIDAALNSGSIDFAVHSLKDVSVDYPFGLVTPPRASPFDVLVSPYDSLDALPVGAKVGTGSPRRASELLRLRPDLHIMPLRGNIDTRLSALGTMDAVVLSEAGLRRLGRWECTDHQYVPLSHEIMIPAPGQGTLAIACRMGDEKTMHIIEQISDEKTYLASMAERSFFRCIGGGCHLPGGAYATIENGLLRLSAAISSPDGSISYRGSSEGVPAAHDAIARRLSASLCAQGASSLEGVDV
jgi:hydroxymethylbilane synthase